MKKRHAAPLALAAAGLLTACGGGDTAPEAVLFGADEASRLQALMNAGEPEEITEEEAARRAAQDRTGGHLWWLDSDITQERGEAFIDLAYDHWNEVEWHGVLAKNGVTLYGSRSGDNRALGLNMEHGAASIFTTDALGGGISASVSGAASDSAPDASATWRGLMIGADKESRDLLQGDAAISFDFADTSVDVSFTDIVNLDRMAAHPVSSISFTDIPVSADGRWSQGSAAFGRNTPNFIAGGFAGPGHEVAGGVFWTPDMLGAYGARQQ